MADSNDEGWNRNSVTMRLDEWVIPSDQEDYQCERDSVEDQDSDDDDSMAAALRMGFGLIKMMGHCI